MKPIRVLIIEDSEDDALLLLEELRENGFDPDYVRIETEEAMREAIAGQDWDVIIADFKLPHFDGSRALTILQETNRDIPFILVSGTADLSTGVDMMRRGAHDFISKDRLSRVGPAVSRELREAQFRKERVQAIQALKESEERYRLIAETATDAIITIDERGNVLFANPAAERIFGYRADELVGQQLTILMPEGAREPYERALSQYLSTGRKHRVWREVEVTGLHKDGRHIPLEASYSEYVHAGEHIFTGIIRDITERKEAEAREQRMEERQKEFYRRTLLAATNGKLRIASNDDILAAAGPPMSSWEIQDVRDVATARDGLWELAREAGMDEARIPNLLVSAVEAMANALKHAGGGTAWLHRVDNALLFMVADHGKGIETLALPDVALTRGYTTAISLGMGYKIMLEFADRVYLATDSGGTMVAMQMSLHEQAQPPLPDV